MIGEPGLGGHGGKRVSGQDQAAGKVQAGLDLKGMRGQPGGAGAARRGTFEGGDREVALRCTHMGFAYDPQAIAAVLRELDR